MDLSVQQKFSTYPEDVSVLLNGLRDLIFNVAKQDGISDITETLKWGEPSYVSKVGSTIILDWKAKYDLDFQIKGIESITSFVFKKNHLKYKTFISQEMLKNNILVIQLANNKEFILIDEFSFSGSITPLFTD